MAQHIEAQTQRWRVWSASILTQVLRLLLLQQQEHQTHEDQSLSAHREASQTPREARDGVRDLVDVTARVARLQALQERGQERGQERDSGAMPEAGPPRDQGATQPATDLTATVADIAAFAHTMRDALAVQHEPPSDHPVWGAELREFTAAERRWGIETGPPLPWEQDARYFTMARWEAEVAELPLSPQATCAERQHPEEDWSHPGTSLTKDEQARPWDTLAERLQALQARLEARQQAMAQDHGQEMRV